jgi:hypothetical protein
VTAKAETEVKKEASATSSDIVEKETTSKLSQAEVCDKDTTQLKTDIAICR